MAEDVKGKTAQAPLPLDKNGNPLRAILLPITNGSGTITGYIPLAYEEDGNGRAILHVKIIP